MVNKIACNEDKLWVLLKLSCDQKKCFAISQNAHIAITERNACMSTLFSKRNIKLAIIILLPILAILIILLTLPKPAIRPVGKVSHTASSAKNAATGSSKAFDSDLKTAWVPAKTSDPRYEFIQTSWSEPVLISGMRLINGYASDRNAYLYGAKLRTARVLLSDYSSYYWTLREDEPEMQEISFSQTHDVRWVKLFIHSVYKGTSEPPEEIGIAEIEFF
jgi:hypothetical protein